MQENDQVYGPGARRFHGEIDKVLATKPNNLSYRDFTYFDYMNIGVREKLSQFFQELDTSYQLTVIDLGSGTGCESRFIAETFGCKVYSLDYAFDMCQVNTRINQACGLDKQITVICGDAAEMDLVQYGLVGNVDVIITIHAMLFVSEKEKLWNMCHRALKQGGKLYVEDFLVDKRAQLEPEDELFINEISHMKDQSDAAEYIDRLWNAGFFVELYEHNIQEKTQALFQICEDYLRRKEEILRDYGEEIWNGRPKIYVEHVAFSVARTTNLSLDELQERYPLLWEYKGQQEFQRWINKRQRVILPRIIATKV